MCKYNLYYYQILCKYSEYKTRNNGGKLDKYWKSINWKRYVGIKIWIKEKSLERNRIVIQSRKFWVREKALSFVREIH